MFHSSTALSAQWMNLSSPDQMTDWIRRRLAGLFMVRKCLRLVAAFSKVAGTILPSPSWPAVLNQGGRWADRGILLIMMVHWGVIRRAISTAMMPPRESPMRTKGSDVLIWAISLEA